MNCTQSYDETNLSDEASLITEYSTNNESETSNDDQDDEDEVNNSDQYFGQGSSKPSNCSDLTGEGPDIQWIKSIAGSNEEAHAHFVYTTDDNNYIQVGETGFLFDNSAKIFVVKTDMNGNLIWKKEFGDNGHNLGNSVFEVSDGYIISGSIDKNSALIKLDKNSGDSIWIKTFDNGGTDAIESAVETPYGLIGVGYINAEDENNTFYTEGEGYITFVDLQGNKTSGKLLDSKMSHAYRIFLFDNKLMISGLTPGAEDYVLMKTNLSGDTDWIKTYGGDKMDHCFAMDIGSDNSVFLSGHTLSGTKNWDTYTMKIDKNGNKVWEKKRGNPRGYNPLYIHDEVWDLKATPDGGCIIVAGTGDEYDYSENCDGSIDQSDTWHVYVIKFNSEGNIEWDKTYYDLQGSDWAGEAIDLTSDGGAIIAVDNSLFGFLKIAPF